MAEAVRFELTEPLEALEALRLSKPTHLTALPYSHSLDDVLVTTIQGGFKVATGSWNRPPIETYVQAVVAYIQSQRMRSLWWWRQVSIPRRGPQNSGRH